MRSSSAPDPALCAASPDPERGHRSGSQPASQPASQRPPAGEVEPM
jgi:hypothetical protein